MSDEIVEAIEYQKSLIKHEYDNIRIWKSQWDGERQFRPNIERARETIRKLEPAIAALEKRSAAEQIVVGLFGSQPNWMSQNEPDEEGGYDLTLMYHVEDGAPKNIGEILEWCNKADDLARSLAATKEARP